MKKRGKRVLILGGTGYLGRALTESCLLAGHRVFLFNRGKSRERVVNGATLLQGNRCDIEDLKVLKSYCYDTVIDSTGWYSQTLKSLLDILKTQTNHYLFVSSIAVYKGGIKKIIDESAERGINSYFRSYGMEKYRCEEHCLEAYQTNLNGTILRFPYIIGFQEKQYRENLLFQSLIQKKSITVPEKRDAKIQFIHYLDIVKLMLHLIEYPAALQSHSYHFTHPQLCTIEEWILKAAEALGVEPLLDYQPFHWLKRNLFFYTPADIVVSNQKILLEYSHSCLSADSIFTGIPFQSSAPAGK